MGFLDQSLDKAAAFCVGFTAMALGVAPPGMIETAVGAAGVVGFVLGSQQKFGPESDRVRKRIQANMLKGYRDMVSGSDGNWMATVDLDAADAALSEVLGDCVIDRAQLAKAAVSVAGFADQAVAVVMTGLGEKRPDLFGAALSETLPYRFARDVVRAGIAAAVENVEYYRALEPALTFEMARALGGVRDTVDTVAADLKRNTALLEQIAAQMGLGGPQRTGADKIAALESELNATRADLLALLGDIVGQGIDESQMPTALRAAKEQLDQSRADLERLRSLANEVPEIEDDLAAARAALDNPSAIDLAAAQAAITGARERYQQAERARRTASAVNLARLMEAEASIALARSDYLAGARLLLQAAGELPGSEATLSAELLVKAGSAFYESGLLFPGPQSMCEAVEAYEAALRVFAERKTLADWAVTQNNRGNALLALGERAGGEAGLIHLKAAVEAYEAVLRIFTERDMPAAWATTQNNLGNALHAVGDRASGEAGLNHLKAALAAYDAALRVQTERDMPDAWAMTQNNRGNVLLTLGDRVGGEAGLRDLKAAVEAYDAALRVRTERDMPADWAMTQNNRANVLLALGDCVGGEAGSGYLKAAVEAYDAALRVRTERDMPADWAKTQNNRGNVLRALGQRVGGEAGLNHLKAAVEAYEAVLRVFTQRDMPAAWAATQNNRGNAFLALGDCVGGEAGLRDLKAAVEAYDAALRVRTERDMPADWAVTQNNRANALLALGDCVGGEAGLRDLKAAVEAYDAALRVRTERDMPADWAMTQNKRGSALLGLGQRVGGEAGLIHLKAAVEAYDATLQYTQRDMPAVWAMTQNNRGNALLGLGQRVGGEAGLSDLKAAVEAYDAALRVFRELDMPLQLTIVQRNLTRAFEALKG